MKHGFTLVELSVVLVVIGLLIGGILIAQSMIDTARLTRFVTNLQQYEIAVKQFNQKFRRYPGDSTYFNPPGAPDGRLFYGDIDGDGIYDITQCNSTLSNLEYRQVWAHLSQASMLAKNYAAYSPISCGGMHHNDYENIANLQLYPYTELDGVTEAYFEKSKHPIYVYKNETGNVSFGIITSTSDLLAIESKLGSQNYDGSEMQVGMINGRGVGMCSNFFGPFDCTDPSAKYGSLYYYLSQD